MNPKFFDVKKEKQDAIINAALKVFAENGYRKASTDVIVKEASISKGLLFHYFISKSGVYEFIYDYSVKYMMLELTNAVNRKETDFFAIQRMIEACKTRVMKNYPYMQQFLTGAKYETHPDALKAINASEKGIEDAYSSIYKKVDMTRFPKDVDLDKVIRMIGWMSDGYIKDKFMDGTPDLDEMNAEFAEYLAMLRGRFYGKTLEEAAPVVEEAIDTTDAVRDDSVMDSMRETTVSRLMEEKTEELSFEERLERGKRSAYDQGPDVTDEAAQAEESPITEEPAMTEETPVNADEAEIMEEKEEGDSRVFSIDEEPEIQSSMPEIKVSEMLEDKKDEVKDAAAEEPADTSEGPAAPAETVEAAEVVTESRKTSKDKKKNKKADDSSLAKDKEMREVTISINDFSDAFKSYDTYTYGGKGTLYAASGAVKTYIPDFKVTEFYETSRLDDFTYGSDSRGGRGIPYDSSDNIQIFVEEDDEEDDYDYPDYSYEPPIEEAAESEQGIREDEVIADAPGNDDIDLDGLTDKIMTNTEKESAEFDRARELSEMGPAPVLPDFSPEKLRKMNDNVGDEDDENSHLYRPINF